MLLSFSGFWGLLLSFRAWSSLPGLGRTRVFNGSRDAGLGTAEATLTHLFTRRVNLNPEPGCSWSPLDRGQGKASDRKERRGNSTASFVNQL